MDIDDFANDKEIIKNRKLEAELLRLRDSSIKNVADTFNAQKSSHKNLKQFLLHKSVSIPFVFESYEGKWKNRGFYFCIFSYESSVHAGRINNSGVDYYFAGVFDLAKNYPHTIAQPETVALKIENLITKADVDFDHAKKFSRKFYLVTKDRQALEILFLNKDLDRITEHPGAEFELNENQCYFRTGRKPVSPEEAGAFIELAKILLEIL
ncbi:hypothetical protein [Ferruginibacter profundus]